MTTDINSSSKETIIIFAKKEIFLIFIFMILVAVISFAVGIKVGKNMGLAKSGITEQDQRLVELKSQKEEDIQKLMVHEEAADAHGVHGASPAVSAHGVVTDGNKVMETNFQKLREEFNRIDERGGAPSPAPATQEEMAQSEAQEGKNIEHSATAGGAMAPVTLKEKKYTIQLSSFPAQDDAVKFADGFRVRGYNPIVSEVSIEGKGRWYRVSLGTFDSMIQARKYIEQEESVFQGQNYLITDFE